MRPPSRSRTALFISFAFAAPAGCVNENDGSSGGGTDGTAGDGGMCMPGLQDGDWDPALVD